MAARITRAQHRPGADRQDLRPARLRGRPELLDAPAAATPAASRSARSQAARAAASSGRRIGPVEAHLGEPVSRCLDDVGRPGDLPQHREAAVRILLRHGQLGDAPGVLVVLLGLGRRLEALDPGEPGDLVADCQHVGRPGHRLRRVVELPAVHRHPDDDRGRPLATRLDQVRERTSRGGTGRQEFRSASSSATSATRSVTSASSATPGLALHEIQEPPPVVGQRDSARAAPRPDRPWCPRRRRRMLLAWRPRPRASRSRA